MKEKLLQIRNMIQENVKEILDEETLEILSISFYILSSFCESLGESFPTALRKTHFIVGKEDIWTMFTNEFGSAEHQLDKKANAAFVTKYAYEEDIMHDHYYFLLSTQLNNPVETIVRTCSELLHLLRHGESKIVGEKVRTINGVNVDVINPDKMEIKRKHVTFENAAIQLYTNEAIQSLVEEISILTNKELQTISPLLARFGKEIPTYSYDVYAYETAVVRELCMCPSLANALDLSFSEDKDVTTFAEYFNSIFGSSSAFLKFSRALDEVAEKGEDALDALLTIQHVLLHVRDRSILETFRQTKETLKK